MRLVRTLVLRFAPLLLAGAVHAAAHVPRVVEASGPHYRVICHFGSSAAAEAALEAAEASWPIATRVYGVDATPPEVPWDIHLFRTQESFDRACMLTAGRTWSEHAGVTTRAGLSILRLGYLYSEEAFERVGLPLRELALVAHEATHLVGFHRADGYQRHPAWLTEGLAEWVSQRTSSEQGWSLGLDDDPSGATDIVYLQEFLHTQRLPQVESILSDDLADVSIEHRYALYGAFMSFLFDTVYAETIVQSLRAPGLSRKQFLRMFRHSLPSGGVPKLEESFWAYLKDRNPAWTLESGWLERRGEEWLHIAPEDWAALAWRRPWIGPGHYSLSGKLENFASSTPQRLHVMLGRLRWSADVDGQPSWSDRFLSVSFSSDEGVKVFTHRRGADVGTDAGDDERQLLASNAAFRVLPGVMSFRIDAHEDHLHILIDGDEVLRCEVPSNWRSLEGQWGVLADAGSYAVWSDLRADY